jgi:hypothetical protein
MCGLLCVLLRGPVVVVVVVGDRTVSSSSRVVGVVAQGRRVVVEGKGWRGRKREEMGRLMV